MKTTAILAGALFAFFALTAQAEAPRLHQRIDDLWKFSLGDPAEAAAPGYEDSAWRTVTLPHDWSIEGNIDPKAPMGGGGGFFPAGLGWYRHHFDAPEAWKDRRVRVEFEGVYMNATVYLNGQKLAFHPYGYTSFIVDLTPALKIGAANVLAVRVDNSRQKNSRWYSGSGIYRHVWLTVTEPVHLVPRGVFVSTARADAASATVNVKTQVVNEGAEPVEATVETTVLSPSGDEITKGSSAPLRLAPGQTGDIDPECVVANPALWSPENPRMSAVRTRVSIGGRLVDEVVTPFGIRRLAWSAEQGLTLNGKTYKLSGGCIHHDNGVLGACAFDRAEERKIELLKAAGFNAIRTAHNPPSPALLDACDRLGMLVMDEAFDCWFHGKNSNDYNVVFKDWWERDIDSMVSRDRNHPSVIMWSIGNEIPDVFSDMGGEYGPKLADRIRSLDPTRPVTNGILGWPADAKTPKPTDADRQKNAEANWNSLDIVGSNYALNRHISQQDRFPRRVLVSTESNPPIGKAFEVLDNPFVVGDFVWSAQDYLGESGVGRWFYAGDPTEPLNPPKIPGDTKPNPVMHGNDRLYPWHGANSGDLDLLGNQKPAAHLRNIVWNMGEKLALAVRQPDDAHSLIVVGWGWFPTWDSWTWPGREGKPMEAEVYSRYPAVRLYLNDRLVGEQPTTRAQGFRTLFKLDYAPGTLKAVGLEDGKEVGLASLVTTGAPVALKLAPDRTTLHADGQDLSFISVEAVDGQGRLQPNADQTVSFTLTGPASIAGLGNANLKGSEAYQGTTCRLYHGRALVVVRTTRQAGACVLTATADRLAATDTTITTR